MSDLTQSQIEEFRDAFKMFDKDGDGTITTKELETVMRTFGQNPSKAELKAMFDEVDIDGNGTVDFEEFLMLMSRKMAERNDNNDFVETFKIFDQDGDGFISRSELGQVMAKLGQNLSDAELDQMIRDADSDGNNKIDFAEFVKMMKNQ